MAGYRNPRAGMAGWGTHEDGGAQYVLWHLPAAGNPGDRRALRAAVAAAKSAADFGDGRPRIAAGTWRADGGTAPRPDRGRWAKAAAPDSAWEGFPRDRIARGDRALTAALPLPRQGEPFAPTVPNAVGGVVLLAWSMAWSAKPKGGSGQLESIDDDGFSLVMVGNDPGGNPRGPAEMIHVLLGKIRDQGTLPASVREREIVGGFRAVGVLDAAYAILFLDRREQKIFRRSWDRVFRNVRRKA